MFAISLLSARSPFSPSTEFITSIPVQQESFQVFTSNDDEDEGSSESVEIQQKKNHNEKKSGEENQWERKENQNGKEKQEESI